MFTYHRVGDGESQPWDRRLWSATAEALDEQFETLVRHTDVVGPADITDAMRRGVGRRVLLTFDDGYRDNYDIAFPVLRRHGLRATFFLVTGFVDAPAAAWWDEIAWMVRKATRMSLAAGENGHAGSLSLLPDDHGTTIASLVRHYKTLPDAQGERFLAWLADTTGSGRCSRADIEDLWMTWDMAREMRSAGMWIGGHTVTHPVLSRLSPERQREEIGTCGRRLVEELGEPMRWFAYPVGARDAFNATTQAIARECGVELAFSFYGGRGHPLHWNPLDTPRINVDSAYGPRLIEATICLPQIFAR